MPPIIPLIVYVSQWIGAKVLGMPFDLFYNPNLSIKYVYDNIAQQFVGGNLLALAFALVFGGITFIFVSLRKKQLD